MIITSFTSLISLLFIDLGQISETLLPFTILATVTRGDTLLYASGWAWLLRQIRPHRNDPEPRSDLAVPM